MYKGDFNHGAVIAIYINTSEAAGGSVDFSGALETSDFRIYKNGSATQRTSMAGVTVTGAGGFDSLPGMTLVLIDTSDNTDADFYAPGSEYALALAPDTETVDGQTIKAALAEFSLNRRHATMPWVGKLTAVTSASVFTLPAECPAVAHVLRDAMIVPLSGTGKDQTPRIVSAYTSGRVATVSPAFTTEPDTTTYVGIVKRAPTATTETDALVAAISQAVLKASMMLDGNKVAIDGDEFVLYDTDGVTELGRAPFTRLGAAANPLESVG